MGHVQQQGPWVEACELHAFLQRPNEVFRCGILDYIAETTVSVQ